MPSEKTPQAVSYVISVTLGTGCYRHIRIAGSADLYTLHTAILDAFEFEDDHAHAFFMNNKAWDERDAFYSDMIDDADAYTHEVTLNQLQLTAKKKFLYIFDFGDEWRFGCNVLQVVMEETEQPVLLKQVGDAPQQYPCLE